MASKNHLMVEIPSLKAEKNSGCMNRRHSCAVTCDDSAGTSREFASKYKRSKSAEPRIVKETEISDDVVTDIDGSVGTYLVVPHQGQKVKTTPDDKKNPLFVFSHNRKKLSLDQMLPSPVLSHASLSETPVDVQTEAESSSTDWPDHSKFHVLGSVLQQRSAPGVRDGYITSQETTSVGKIVESAGTGSSGAEATPLQFASSDDSLDSATNEQLFQVREEHVAQQRKVTVEREQCITKEKAAMTVVKGHSASCCRHRAVTVSRSQTWSFRDRSKSDQLLREADTARTQDSELGSSSEQLLDDTSAHDLGLTVSGCLLRDYDKDKGWSSVPWTDKPGNQ